MHRVVIQITLFLICFYSLGLFAQEKDPVLMTIGNSDQVKLSEFEYIYKKNNPDSVSNSAESIEEYLDLFVNFKLKVKEAMMLKMDTNPKFINELAGYRAQLAQPYLVDREITEKLMKEAYERSKYDIHAKHILVKFNDNPTPADTADAYALMESFVRKLNKLSFDELMSKENGQQYGKLKIIAEDLGYFSAFMMVYNFENAAYNTEVGKVSPIIRTRFGYHILKVYDKRPARGEIKVAHIMVSSKNGDPKAKDKKAKIDEIYTKLQKGEDFGKLAKMYSDDHGSSRMNGQLPWFGPGKMVPEFEEAAFSIAENGSFCEPIKTSYGWHIIKRLDKKEIGSFDEMKNEIKNKINRDSRGSKGKDALIANIKLEYGFATNKKALSEMTKIVDDSYKKGRWKVPGNKELNKVLFALEDKKYSNKKQTYTQKDFAEYLLRTQKKYSNLDKEEFIQKSYDEYVNMECIKFEDSLLEDKYFEFKALMNEYRDGILLFDLMDKKVWSKAVKDTVGLAKFYEANKLNYMWEERVDASIYTCANESIAKKAKKLASKQAKKGYTDQQILDMVNEESQLDLQIKSKLYLKGDNDVVDNIEWKEGITEFKKINDQIVFVHVKNVIPPTPKSLNEARGIITADYQKYLEEQWIAELKAKYPVTINKDVLKLIK